MERAFYDGCKDDPLACEAHSPSLPPPRMEDEKDGGLDFAGAEVQGATKIMD